MKSTPKDFTENCCRQAMEENGARPTGPKTFLAQSDTGTNRPPHMKKWGLYAGLAALLIMLSVAGISYYRGNAEQEPDLSVRQAVRVFSQEGIQLSKTNDSQAEAIHGVKPSTYFINGTESKLHIYRYGSMGERKTAEELWRAAKEPGGLFSDLTSAKNLSFMIELAAVENITPENIPPVVKISEIIFEKLNDTKEIVYSGSGENWAAQTVVKYYEYFYYKEDATLTYDSYHKESTRLTYLGEDIDSVGRIAYEIKQPRSGSSGTGRFLEPDGTVSLGSGGGNGSIPRGDEEMIFTIKWNDRAETFIATAK